MNRDELRKALVITKILDGILTIREAAIQLELSERQVKRLKAKMQRNGAVSLIHGNRGRKPKHTLDPKIAKQVVALAQEKYQGANYTHLSELLQEHEGISISPSSVGRILKAASIKSSRKHAPTKRHPRRPRKPQEGMLIQIDASLHRWLGDRGPKLSLVGGIDDATGKIVGAVFRPQEDSMGYFLLLDQILHRYGIPEAIYSDRHTIHFSPTRDKLTVEEELQGKKVALTQFGRALDELLIQHIAARSPQAKGRIERLWGTLQDRLVLHLSLLGACTLEAANAALPAFIEQYNARFAVAPADSLPVYRPVVSLDLEHILCMKETRTLSNGNVFSFEGNLYQVLLPNHHPFLAPRTKVTVCQSLDGFVTAGIWNNWYPTALIPPQVRATG